MESDPLNIIISDQLVLLLGAPVCELLNASASRAFGQCSEGPDDNDGFDLTSTPSSAIPDKELDPRIVHAAFAPTLGYPVSVCFSCAAF